MTLSAGQHHLTLRRLKQLMYLSLVVTILCLTLLFWVYSPPRTTVQAQNPATLLPGPVPQQPEKVPLVVVNGTHTLLLSAYMEHRMRKVRIIAVAQRTEAVTYRCNLSCQETQWEWNNLRTILKLHAPKQSQYHISVGARSFHADHFRFEYGTVDILCPLPTGCGAPLHVAVTSTANNVTVEEQQPVFLEVLNQEMRSDSFPHNFTVCISAMFNYNNVLQLVQSIEMLRLLGVTRVVVYKTSCSPDAQRILDYYTHTGLVEVIPWSISSHLKVSASWLPSLSPGQIHYYGQIPVLNDCLYRYMYQTQYIAFHDIDELILPQQVDSWSELLPLLEQKYGADFGYKFQNTVFRNTVIASPPPPPPTSPLPHHQRHDGCCPPEWQGVPGVNILAHLFHEPMINNPLSNVKIIVNPRAVFSPTVHNLLHSTKGCVLVNKTIAKLYHTRAPWQTRLPAEQLVYDGRLLSYSTRLIPAVNAVLRQTGLIPLNHTSDRLDSYH